MQCIFRPDETELEKETEILTRKDVRVSSFLNIYARYRKCLLSCCEKKNVGKIRASHTGFFDDRCFSSSTINLYSPSFFLSCLLPYSLHASDDEIVSSIADIYRFNDALGFIRYP